MNKELILKFHISKQLLSHLFKQQWEIFFVYKITIPGKLQQLHINLSNREFQIDIFWNRKKQSIVSHLVNSQHLPVEKKYHQFLSLHKPLCNSILGTQENTWRLKELSRGTRRSFSVSVCFCTFWPFVPMCSFWSCYLRLPSSVFFQLISFTLLSQAKIHLAWLWAFHLLPCRVWGSVWESWTSILHVYFSNISLCVHGILDDSITQSTYRSISQFTLCSCKVDQNPLHSKTWMCESQMVKFQLAVKSLLQIGMSSIPSVVIFSLINIWCRPFFHETFLQNENTREGMRDASTWQSPMWRMT